jgi:hypothetical protein
MLINFLRRSKFTANSRDSIMASLRYSIKAKTGNQHAIQSYLISVLDVPGAL